MIDTPGRDQAELEEYLKALIAEKSEGEHTHQWIIKKDKYSETRECKYCNLMLSIG